MKLLYTLIICFIITFNLLSQAVCYRDFDDATNTYEVLDTFPSIQIADDFGPRHLKDDWHGGVDFNSGAGNSDLGDMLLTP